MFGQLNLVLIPYPPLTLRFSKNFWSGVRVFWLHWVNVLIRFFGKYMRTGWVGLLVVLVNINIKISASEAVWLGRPFIKLVDEATTVPGEGHSFKSFAAPFEPRFTLRDQTVHLVAPAATVNFNPARGLFRHEAGVLKTLVFTNTVAPDGTPFTDTFYPTDLGDGAINFSGSSQEGAKQGFYELRGGVVTKILDNTDPIPGGSGTFLGFGGTARRGGRAVGAGQTSSGLTAMFLLDGVTVTKIADSDTDLPGVVTGFGGITGVGVFGFDGATAVFGTQTGFAPNGASAVIAYTVGSGFEKVADSSDFMPGDAGRFNGFADSDVDGGSVFFTAFTSSNQKRLFSRTPAGSTVSAANNVGLISAAGARSVYYTANNGLSRWTDGYIEAVVVPGNTIDGKTVQSVFGVSGQGDDVAVGIRFGDATHGVYLAAGPQPAAAPQLVTDLPASRTFLQGSNSRLTIVATGGALAYQWSKDSVRIDGATGPFLAFPAVALADAGKYKVVVSNSVGTVASVETTLAVAPATTPAISTPPASVLVAVGGTVTFSVAATGSPLFYQWRFNGQPLPGANLSSLRIDRARESDFGDYSVVVSNPAGSQTSAAASLGVAAPPTISRQPVGGLVATGASFTFTVAASGDAPLTYQWKKGTANLSLATGPSHTISAMSAADAGLYSVVVSNPYGQAVSQEAILALDIPGAKLPIATFRTAQPAVNGGRIVVPRDNNDSFGSIDLYEHGAFRTLVDNTMTAAGAASRFKSFAAVEIDGDDLAFTATLADNSTGLFLRTGPEVRRIVDTAVLLPDLRESFTSVSVFSLSGGKLAFQGTGSAGTSGVFLYDGAVLRRIAAKGGAAPGGRAFLNFGGVDMAAGALVFWASLDTGGGGIFAWKDNVLSKVVDYQANTLPGLTPGFFGISNQTPATDGATVAFTTVRGADLGALWTAKLDGTSPVKIAEKGQAAHSGGQFNTFDTLVMDGGQLVFSGFNQSFQRMIYHTKSGATTRIIAETDTINGFAGQLSFSNDGFSNGRMAVGRNQFGFNYDILLINVSAEAAPVAAPSIVQQPPDLTLNIGERAQLDVAGNAPGLSFQWFKGNAAVMSATTAILVIPAVQAPDAGDYYCVLSNSAGSATSRVARITINGPSGTAPHIAVQPTGKTVDQGAPVTFNVGADGTGPLTYQWRKNNEDIPPATNSTYFIASAQPSHAGSYTVVVRNLLGSETSQPAVLAVTPVVVGTAPNISTQPMGATVTAGAEVNITVAANGSEPLVYQWRKGTMAVDGANGPTLHFGSVSTADAGVYSVFISNALGNITSMSVQLVVNPSPTAAPQIVSSPRGRQVNAGERVTLTVAVSGAGPFTFVWKRNNSVIATATTDSFDIPAASAADAGSYVVEVSNAGGTTPSAAANVVVIIPPTVSQDPVGLTVGEGASVVFSAAATGTEPFGFQWRKNGADLPGKVGPQLILSAVTLADAGDYSVRVSNPAGSATSRNAALVVQPVTARALVLEEIQFIEDRLAATLGIDALGNENRVALSIAFNQAAFQFFGVQLLLADPANLGGKKGVHPGIARADSILAVDTNQLPSGLVGVTISLPPGQTLPPGHSELANLVFRPIEPNASLADARLAITSGPVEASISDANGNSLAVTQAVLPVGAPASVSPTPSNANGLFLQAITVVNPGAADIFARILVRGLGVDSLGNPIRLFNAAGSANGVPFLLAGPVRAGVPMVVAAEFYVSDRRTVPTPSIEVQIGSDFAPAVSASHPVTITRRDGPGGLRIVEFLTAPGVAYYIQYAPGAAGPWRTSLPAVSGTGSRVQWIDSGPPRTDSPPSAAPTRIYRVFQQ